MRNTFDILLNMLSKSSNVKPALPIKGQRWVFKEVDEDPWGSKKYRPVIVIDVKDNWVRYDMGPGPFRDERKRVEEFMNMYSLVQ